MGTPPLPVRTAASDRGAGSGDLATSFGVHPVARRGTTTIAGRAGTGVGALLFLWAAAAQTPIAYRFGASEIITQGSFTNSAVRKNAATENPIKPTRKANASAPRSAGTPGSFSTLRQVIIVRASSDMQSAKVGSPASAPSCK